MKSFILGVFILIDYWFVLILNIYEYFIVKFYFFCDLIYEMMGEIKNDIRVKGMNWILIVVFLI